MESRVKLGYVGESRDGLVPANILHLHDAHHLVLDADRESEVLAIGVRGVIVMGVHGRLHER